MSAFSFFKTLVKNGRNAYRAGLGRKLQPGCPEFWEDVPQRVLSGADCTFVLSTGRCGTQLVTDLLCRCASVDVNHHAEIASELQYPSRLAYEQSQAAPEMEFDHAVLCNRYEPIQTSFLNGRIYVETNNRITFFAPSLRNVFGRSRFIHLIRNPVSFVRSGVNAGFYSGGYYDTGRIVPIAGPYSDQWRNFSRPRKVAWLWNETNKYIERFKPTVSADRMMTVKAEDLFSDPSVAERIIAFVNARPIARRTIQRMISRAVNKGHGDVLPRRFADWPNQYQRDVIEMCTLADQYEYDFDGPSWAQLSRAA